MHGTALILLTPVRHSTSAPLSFVALLHGHSWRTRLNIFRSIDDVGDASGVVRFSYIPVNRRWVAINRLINTTHEF